MLYFSTPLSEQNSLQATSIRSDTGRGAAHVDPGGGPRDPVTGPGTRSSRQSWCRSPIPARPPHEIVRPPRASDFTPLRAFGGGSARTGRCRAQALSQVGWPVLSHDGAPRACHSCMCRRRQSQVGWPVLSHDDAPRACRSCMCRRRQRPAPSAGHDVSP